MPNELFKPDTRPFNVINLSREDFDRIGIKPDNYLFFVLDKIVKGESIVNVYSLYKGNVQVGVGDIIGSLPDSMKASNGGFRAMAFTRSEGKPEKPRESDFGTYYDLVNSKQAWQSRPDNLSGTGQIWVSFHWFTGSPAESLDTGDMWTDPVRLTGLNGADGKDGLNGRDGLDGLNGRDGSNGKDGANGTGVFIRFNSSVSEPERPTDMGIDGGWSSNQKEDSRWISLKQGKTASDGKWGEPVQIKCNLIRYDASDGSIRDEFGNFLGMAFSPVYSIDTEQVIPLTVLDRYKFDTSTPLRVNCYVSTPQGSRALLNPENYELMCKVRDSRTNPIEEKTFALEYANKEWLLPLEEWYDKSNATDFIELHLFAKNGEAGSGALAIKLIQLVRDGEAGKITSVKAETLAPGSQATVRNEGDIHDAKLVIGIPRGDKGERGDPFMINRTYPSVAAMNADFGNANVPLFAMVLIDTGNVEDEDNAKLYIKNTTGFTFLTDLSGAQGIRGDMGYSFRKGEVSSVNDNGEVVFSSITPSQGLQVGDIIVGFNEELGYYGQLFRITDVENLIGTDLSVSLRGQKGETGSHGLGIYRTSYKFGASNLDGFYIPGVFPSSVLNGKTLQKGDLFIEGSESSNLFIIESIEGDRFHAKFLISLRGAAGENGQQGATFTPSVSAEGELSWTNDNGLENPAPVNIKGPQGATGADGKDGKDGKDGSDGAKGDTGAQGLEGLGIFRSSTTTTISTTSIALSSITIPTGHSVKVGDLIIANNVSSYLYQVTGVFSTYINVTYLTSLRGATGGGSVTVDAALNAASENPVQNKAVTAELNKKAPLASPTFTGNPKAPSPTSMSNDTSIATTAFVQNRMNTKANIASPAFTGTPTAPTPATTDNSTKIATTAFVKNAVKQGGGGTASTDAPYEIRMVSIDKVYLNRPLEDGYEIALFRKSTTYPAGKNTGRVKGHGWRMPLNSVNLHRFFSNPLSAALYSRSTDTSPMYELQEMRADVLMRSFAERDTEEGVIRLYNCHRKHSFWKEARKVLHINLGYAVVKRLTKSGYAWNGRYELCSNIAKFRVMLASYYKENGYTVDDSKWYKNAEYMILV